MTMWLSYSKMLSNITSMTTLRYGPYYWIKVLYSKS